MEEDAPGIELVREFLGVHEMLRVGLRRCSELAQRAAAGLPPAQTAGEWPALRSGSLLWELRDNCFQHCFLLRRHHLGEDDALFPELRVTDGSLSPVLDRLEAEHREIALLIDRVIQIAESISGSGGEQGTGALVAGLRQLEEELLKHLSAEEEALVPALLRWREWPQP
jgi:iron-sulfur cluster repair protein YtfE (RIC family)